MAQEEQPPEQRQHSVGRTPSQKGSRYLFVCLLALDVAFIAAAATLSFVFSDPSDIQAQCIQNLWNVVWMFSSFAIGWLVGRAAKA